jgi:hypothetical protein
MFWVRSVMFEQRQKPAVQQLPRSSQAPFVTNMRIGTCLQKIIVTSTISLSRDTMVDLYYYEWLLDVSEQQLFASIQKFYPFSKETSRESAAFSTWRY